MKELDNLSDQTTNQFDEVSGQSGQWESLGGASFILPPMGAEQLEQKHLLRGRAAPSLLTGSKAPENS